MMTTDATGCSHPTGGERALTVAVSCLAGNRIAGDDLVLAATLRRLRLHPLVQSVTAFVSDAGAAEASAGPAQYVSSPVPGRALQPWLRSRRARRRVLACTDVLLIGGGGLLQNVHSDATLARCIEDADLAMQAGVPYALFAVGVGPVFGDRMRRWVRQLAEGALCVTVRSPRCAEYLRCLGVARDAEVVADPVATMPLPRARPVSPPRVVGLACRRWPYMDPERLARVATCIASSIPGATIVPMAFEVPDLAFYEEAARRSAHLRVEPPLDLTCLPHERVIESLRGLDAMVAMRLHGALPTARMGIPTIVLAYDPKCLVAAAAGAQLTGIALDDATLCDDIVKAISRDGAARQPYGQAPPADAWDSVVAALDCPDRRVPRRLGGARAPLFALGTRALARLRPGEQRRAVLIRRQRVDADEAAEALVAARTASGRRSLDDGSDN